MQDSFKSHREWLLNELLFHQILLLFNLISSLPFNSGFIVLVLHPKEWRTVFEVDMRSVTPIDYPHITGSLKQQTQQKSSPPF